MSDERIIRVRDVMKAEVGTIDGLATVSDALHRMRELNTAVLIVNKRHADDEFGMLIVTDIARQVLAKDRAPDRVNVYEIMTKPVVSVHPDMDIKYCSRLFTEFNLVRAPVVENGEIIGTISPYAMVMQGLASTI